MSALENGISFSGLFKQVREGRVRLFVALLLPEALKRGCEALQKTLRGRLLDGERRGIRWVAPDHIHLTLVFLGWTDPNMIEKIQDTMMTVSSEFHPVDLTLSGLGVFPSMQRPKIFWVGVTPHEALTAMQQRLTDEMAALGFPKECRPYRPHLTLARIISGESSDPLRHLINRETDTTTAGDRIADRQVDTLALMQSALHPEGSMYTARFTSILH